LSAASAPQFNLSSEENLINLSGPCVALSAFDSMDNEKRIDTESLQREVVVEILRYLVAHPKAKDTISGIEKWWLSKNVSLEGRSKLHESLELLVLKGWLVSRGSPQSETIYSLNEKKVREIEEFIEEGSHKDEHDEDT
jgi:hypothetical protein